MRHRSILPAALAALVLGGGITGPGNASAARTISVNFTGGDGGNHPVNIDAFKDHLIGCGDYARPGSTWVDCISSGTTGHSPENAAQVELKLRDDSGDEEAYKDVKLYLSSRGGTYWNSKRHGKNDTVDTGNKQMRFTFLDDGGTGSAGVKLEGLPFAKYTVVVYFNQDDLGGKIPAYWINGALYKGSTDGAVQAAENDSWGDPGADSDPAEGVNTLIVKNLTDSTLLVKAQLQARPARACISGFQVVEQKPPISWKGGDGDWSAADKWTSPWEDGSDAIFPADGGGTVRVDTNVIAFSLAFNGDYTLTNANGSLALSGPVTVAENKTAAIFAPVSGAINKKGGGTIVVNPDLTGCSSYSFSGPATVQGGTLSVPVTLAADAALTLKGAALQTALAGNGTPLTLEGENTLGDGAALEGFAGTTFAASSLTRIAGEIAFGGLGAIDAGAGSGLAVASGAALSYDFAIGTSLPAFQTLDGTVKVTGKLTPTQILDAEELPVAKVADSVSAEKFTGAVTTVSGDAIGVVFTKGGDGVVTMRANLTPADLVHKKTGAGTAFIWDKGDGRFDNGGTFQDFDNVSFRENGLAGQQETVEVPEDVRAGRVEIESGFTFTNRAVNALAFVKKGAGTSTWHNALFAGDAAVAAGMLDAAMIAPGTLAVSNGATLRAKAVDRRAIRFLRLSITEIATPGNAAAVSELRLFRKTPGGYEKIEWPVDTILTDNRGGECKYKGGSGTLNPQFEGAKANEALNALIDGVYANWGGGNPYPNPHYDDYYWNVRNKWSIQPPAVVTIKFPETIPVPDGYNICAADHGPRHPKDWTVEISTDGADGNWTGVSRVTGARFSMGSWNTSNGGNADKPAFFFDAPAAADIAAVTVAKGGTLVADGDWAAGLTLEGGAVLKAETNRCLTLKAIDPAPAHFGTEPKVTVDLDAYGSLTAGKHYILAGAAADWPDAANFNPIGEIPGEKTFGKDDGGCFVMIVPQTLVWNPALDDSEKRWRTGVDDRPWTKGDARAFFRDNDDVTFGDLGGAAADVNVSGTVKPASAAFNATDGTAYLLRPDEYAGADAKLVLAGALTVDGLVTNRVSCSIGGPVTLGAGGTLVFAPGSNTEQTVSGVISGAGTIVKAGAGAASLTGKNTATGGIEVNAGLLILDAGNDVAKQPFRSVTVAPGAALRLGRDELEQNVCAVTNAGLIETASFNDFGGSLTLDGGTVKTTGAFGSGWKSACYNGTVKVTGGKESFLAAADPANGNLQHQVRNTVFDVDAAARLTVDAVLGNGPNDRGDANSVTKTGPGAMAVKLPPVYDGPTAINGGVYEMNAEQTVGGVYTVAAGAALGGTGSIRSDIALEGTIAAGLACSNITMSAGATVDARAAGSKLVIAGTPTVADGETVRIDVTGRALSIGDVLISWGEGKMPDGSFTLVGGGGHNVGKTDTGAVVSGGGTVLIFR